MKTVEITITVNMPDNYSDKAVDEEIAELFLDLGCSVEDIAEHVIISAE